MKEEAGARGGSVEGRRARLAEALGARGRRSRPSRLRIGSADELVDVAKPAVDAVDAVDATGAPYAPRSSAAPADPAELAARARALARTIDLSCAELIDVLHRLDTGGGRRTAGTASGVAGTCAPGSCVEWIRRELGFAQSTAYQYLQVGRELVRLPVIAAHFRAGRLKLSKVLALVRVATPEDDAALACIALEHEVDELAALLDEYRWGRQAAEDAAAAREGGESARERTRHARRCLRVRKHRDGTATLTANLPAERMALVAGLVEWLARGIRHEARRTSPPGSRPTLAQCRADALERMAQAALTGTGAETGIAGPGVVLPKSAVPLVVAVVDHEVLEPAIADVAARGPNSDTPLPRPVRCAVVGLLGTSIGEQTARRMACEGTLMTMLLKAGEPMSVGREVRLYTRAQRRAIAVRGGHRCTLRRCWRGRGSARGRS